MRRRFGWINLHVRNGLQAKPLLRTRQFLLRGITHCLSINARGLCLGFQQARCRTLPSSQMLTDLIVKQWNCRLKFNDEIFTLTKAAADIAH